MHTSSLYHIYHIQIVSPLNLHWNHGFNANFACIYGHEHKMCINNISQVTNVEIFKKERKSTLSKLIIIITKKESDLPTPTMTSIAVYTNVAMS